MGGDERLEAPFDLFPHLVPLGEETPPIYDGPWGFLIPDCPFSFSLHVRKKRTDQYTPTRPLAPLRSLGRRQFIYSWKKGET